MSEDDRLLKSLVLDLMKTVGESNKAISSELSSLSTSVKIQADEVRDLKAIMEKRACTDHAARLKSLEEAQQRRNRFFDSVAGAILTKVLPWLVVGSYIAHDLVADGPPS